MRRLPSLRPEQLSGDQAALYAAITDGPRGSGPQHFALTADDGSLNGPFNAFLFSPVLGNAIQSVGAAVRYSSSLSARSRELAILIVAARWRSGFERLAHEGVGRAAGLSEDELDTLWSGGIPALEDETEDAIAHLTLAMANGDVSDEEWARFAPVVGEAGAFELSTLVGYYSMLALQLRVFRVDEPPPSGVAGDK